MRKIAFFILIVAIALNVACSGPEKKSTIPSYLKDLEKEFVANPRKTNLEWFKNAKFGLFIHYGLYSILEDGEWVQFRSNPPIPVTEYAKLKDRFTAENFDADFITDLSLKAGMKYITITTKHHDGFCLFETKETDFNSLNSPAKRDLINELYDACEQKGLGLFLYYSYGADWKHPYFMSREDGWDSARPDYEEIQPEYKYEKKEDFEKYIEFAHNQIKELLTQYPNIAGIWFDPIRGYYHRPDMFPIDQTYAMIRSLSPHALISFKQGANGDEDFSAPERHGNAHFNEFEAAVIAGERNKDKPKEVCNTMQPLSEGNTGCGTWGYNKALDGLHVSADEVMGFLSDADSMNYNLLLNVGPKQDGSFPEEDINTLIEVGKRLKSVDQ